MDGEAQSRQYVKETKKDIQSQKEVKSRTEDSSVARKSNPHQTQIPITAEFEARGSSPNCKPQPLVTTWLEHDEDAERRRRGATSPRE